MGAGGHVGPLIVASLFSVVIVMRRRVAFGREENPWGGSDLGA